MDKTTAVPTATKGDPDPEKMRATLRSVEER